MENRGKTTLLCPLKSYELSRFTTKLDISEGVLLLIMLYNRMHMLSAIHKLLGFECNEIKRESFGAGRTRQEGLRKSSLPIQLLK